MGHICRVIGDFLLQAAVLSYYGQEKRLMDLVCQLHPVVWISADVVWTIFY